MDDATLESKKMKDRSPGFPFINLESALERARKVYSEERRGVVPYLRLVKHWNYAEKSSNALQTIAALKQYQLLKEIGGSAMNRQFQLTELALRILLDQRPDSEERESLLRTAAKAPPVANEVYEKWGGELPSDSTINHFLVLEKRFMDSNAPKVTQILKENHRLAKLDWPTQGMRQSDDGMIGLQSDSHSMPEDPSSLSPTLVTPRAVVPRLPAVFAGGGPGAATPSFSENVLLPNGKAVTLVFSEAPDLALYKQLLSFLKWKTSMFETPDAE